MDNKLKHWVSGQCGTAAGASKVVAFPSIRFDFSASSFAALSDRTRLAATLDYTVLMLYVLPRRVASRASRLSLPRRA